MPSPDWSKSGKERRVTVAQKTESDISDSVSFMVSLLLFAFTQTTMLFFVVGQIVAFYHFLFLTPAVQVIFIFHMACALSLTLISMRCFR
jgi:hypothetical protein